MIYLTPTFSLCIISLSVPEQTFLTGRLTDVILVRVAALHVILQKCGIEEGFITVWTLKETNKGRINMSACVLLTKKQEH